MNQDNFTPEEFDEDYELDESFLDESLFEDYDPYKYDPVEQSPEYLAVADELEKAIEKEFPKGSRQLGTCHAIWRFQKKWLKKNHGIDWKSPAELNPGIRFD